MSRYEAPRGEDIHYVRTNGTEMPERVKVRAPTLANLASIREMLKGGFLADVPIVIAAIDPCFSCTDRMIRLDRGKQSELLGMGSTCASIALTGIKHAGWIFPESNRVWW